ncbi:MAG TPA: glutathione S-transferase family protein [Caulobacteraceae bacterium]|nr:glutathione S-transferase family protein [Caulobacteraceae bacterium]
MVLKIWGRRNSQNVQKVMWLVGELGLAHKHIPAGGPFGGLDAPEFLAMNPNGLVPVIDDSGAVVWESHAILRYLAAAHGGKDFWPADPFARSLSDRWIEWCAQLWQPAFLGGVFWAGYRTPKAHRDRAAVARAVARAGDLMLLLERNFGQGAYLTGERLSLGDIPIGSSLYRYFTLDIERPKLPKIEAWYARLGERPAFREHVMVPYDDLEGRLMF